jgi:threonine dehydratase
MGLLSYLRNNSSPIRLFGSEPHHYSKYARFEHAQSVTITDGLILEAPRPQVQQAIKEDGVTIALIPELDIRAALKELFEAQALVVEPSSAITLAFVKGRATELEEPVCVILTGENIAREDHRRLVIAEQDASNVSTESTRPADKPMLP